MKPKKKRLIWEYHRKPFKDGKMEIDTTQMTTFYCHSNDKQYPSDSSSDLENRKCLFGYVNDSGRWELYHKHKLNNRKIIFLSGKEPNLQLAKQRVKKELVKISTFFD